MRELLFYSVFTCFLLSAIYLGFTAISMIIAEPTFLTIFAYQCFALLSNLTILGIGWGIPAILVGSLLGWGHFTLLAKGNIRPHMGHEGFLNILAILLKEL